MKMALFSHNKYMKKITSALQDIPAGLKSWSIVNMTWIPYLTNSFLSNISLNERQNSIEL